MAHKIVQGMEKREEKKETRHRIVIEGVEEYKRASKEIREEANKTIDALKQLNESMEKFIELRGKLFS